MLVSDLAAVVLAHDDARGLGLCEASLHLRRAWPRSAEHLLLEFVTAADEIVPGQWMRDERALESICADIRSCAFDPQRVRIVKCEANRRRVLLQRGGEDRTLRGLAPLLARPSSRLVVHRPERRAVVRCGEGDGVTFAKFLPPKRIKELIRREELLRAASGPGSFNMPALLETDHDAGIVRYAAAPGVSLHERVTTVDEGSMRAVGRALRSFHDVPVDEGLLPAHGPAEEIAVLERWMNFLAAFHPEPAKALEEEFLRTVSALRVDSGQRVTIHRDFYDKQIFIDAGLVTFLDFDTVATGEPALDVANMVAHLELRNAPPALARAFLDGYGPHASATQPRLETYRRAAMLRLQCVHAFRPPFECPGTR